MTLANGVQLDIEVPQPSITMPVPDPTLLVVPVAGLQGPQGGAGATGPPGSPGAPGTPGNAPQSYHHDQGVPSSSWLIPHNLGYNPAGIVVHDSGGTQWEGVVTYLDLNNLRIDYDVVFGGEADLS